MKKKHSQMSWVLTQLVRKGRVTRNQALAKGITRLASYIADAKFIGYKFDVGFIKTRVGKDYEYRVLL